MAAAPMPPALPDGEHWAFKGEGNANIVFSYTGSDPRLVRLCAAFARA